jgi:Integrase zinc binding domain
MPAKGEDVEEDNPEEWIDTTLSLGVWVSTWLVFSPLQLGNLPTLSLVLSAKPSVNTTLATFPVSDQSSKADEDISQIQDYLTTLKLPSNLSEDALAKFLRKVKQFSLIDGQLWRNFSTGRPQMFIPPSERLFIVRDAHDRLGHKGIYSTRCTILDRFWWPSVDQDIKWYVDTCHECQIRQTTKVRIPPTVDKPAPLFRKVYIDTMLMPLASGFHYIVQAHCSLSAWPEWRTL